MKEQVEKVKTKKGVDKEMQEAIRVAQEIERMEEEEQMKKALMISEQISKERSQRDLDDDDEESKMI
jgi:hypothetical protein